MGFGVVLLGYSILLFEILGFDFVGYATIAYGSYLISKHFRAVKYNYVIAIIAALCSAVRMLIKYSIITVSDSGAQAIARLVLEVVIVLAYTAISFLFQIAVAKFARENKAYGLERLANGVRYITTLYFVLKMLMIIFTQTEFVMNFFVVTIILQYVVLFINIYFIYSCFASITTPRLLAKELESDFEFEEREKEKKSRRKKFFSGDDDESGE